MKLRPDDVPTQISLASVSHQLGGDVQAERLITRVLELDPRNAVAIFLRGQVASRREDHTAAAADYERALELQPWASNVHYPLAVTYQRLGDGDRARHHLERRGPRQLSFEDPLMSELRSLTTGVGSYLVRGSQAMQAGNLQVAVLEFGKAAEADPENPTARLNLGAALAQSGRLDGAAIQLRAALQLGLSSVERSRV